MKDDITSKCFSELYFSAPITLTPQKIYWENLPTLISKSPNDNYQPFFDEVIRTSATKHAIVSVLSTLLEKAKNGTIRATLALLHNEKIICQRTKDNLDSRIKKPISQEIIQDNKKNGYWIYCIIDTKNKINFTEEILDPLTEAMYKQISARLTEWHAKEELLLIRHKILTSKWDAFGKMVTYDFKIKGCAKQLSLPEFIANINDAIHETEKNRHLPGHSWLTCRRTMLSEIKKISKMRRSSRLKLFKEKENTTLDFYRAIVNYYFFAPEKKLPLSKYLNIENEPVLRLSKKL